jgi:alpha-mannosidase/mannosylglycerate hydrolase
MMDELLDTMKQNPDFRYFQADGQSILIEDYLEIRPDREADIRELGQAGRLRIGPWYVAPDEFLVSAESLVRNLQLGIQIASQFGRPSRVGFVCDAFGNISQLPQILRGFGIDNAFISRGTSSAIHGALWNWRAPDGSEVITYRFGHGMGYSSYATYVRKATIPDETFDLKKATEDLSKLIDQEIDYCPSPSLLLFDGADHMEIEPETNELINRVNKKRKDIEIVFSHLEAFVEDLREQRDHFKKVFTGELCHPRETSEDIPFIAGVLSSRIHLKQANAHCENELCLWAEPFSAFADGLGLAYPHQYLHVAWRFLLQNHPHDSICTCSIDQVHKDMEYRFDQCMNITDQVISEALRHIALQVRPPELDEKDSAIVVFNATSEALEGPVDLTLRFPHDIESTFFEGFGYENKVGFRLYDDEGKEIPYQLVNQRHECLTFRRPPKKFPTKHVEYELDISAPVKVPAHGYTSIVCRPAKREEPTRYIGTMLVDDHTMENEHLRVSVQPNGTVKLIDKDNSQTYENLLTFEDRSDIGDGWFHVPGVNDQVFSSTACLVDIAVVADGVSKSTLKTMITMNVPMNFSFDKMIRNQQTAPLRIRNLITLRAGSDYIEVKSIVENTIRDHRLRVLMPTGTNADTYFADGAYDVIERAIKLDPDHACNIEMETETKPQYTWTAVHNAEQCRGLAVISTGLPESAVRDLPERPIALTLLRSFFKTVLTNGEEGGQIQGTHEFNYYIKPLADELPRTRLCRLGHLLAAPPRVVQLESKDIYEAADSLPTTYAFIKTTPKQAVITAVHHMDGTEGLIVRMFNPYDNPVNDSLGLAQSVKSVERIDLEGNKIGAQRASGKTIKVAMKPKQIVTLRIT